MKKFRFLLVVAIVLVSALALCLTASASTDVTATTYENIYVGEYNATDTELEGEAYIVFGKVTGTTEAGIIVERYAVDDSAYATVLDTRYYGIREGRISADGEFAIALYDVQDGYYKAKVVAGNPANPTAAGAYTTFSQGVQDYQVTYYKLDGTDETITYTVQAGSYAPIPNFEREGYVITGWNHSKAATPTGTNWQNVDTGFRRGKWGDNMTSNPAAFIVNENRIYAPVWKYVGADGDGKAPDNFSLTMNGYSYLTANSTAGLEVDGAVAVMSFDLLAPASWNSNDPVWIGTCQTNEPPAYNYYTMPGWATYKDNDVNVAFTHRGGASVTNITRSTGTAFNLTNILGKANEGKTIDIVYSPYRSDSAKGYLRAYVNGTLLAGFEGMNATQAPNNVMPCFGRLYNAGEFKASLGNFSIGISTDGDRTIETEHGVATWATSAESPTIARYTSISELVLPAQYKYQAVMSNEINKGPSAVFKFGRVYPSQMADGKYFEMEYTVVESNVDELGEYVPEFGFGLVIGGTMQNNWTGRYGYGMNIGWEATDGEAVSVALVGPAKALTGTSADGNTVGIGMKDLLTAGATVKMVMSLDTQGGTTGYIEIYYTGGDFVEEYVGSISNIPTSNYGGFNFASVGGCPMLTAFAVEDDVNGWRLDMTVTGLSCTTFDANNNVIGSVAIETGTAFNNNTVANSLTQVYPKA